MIDTCEWQHPGVERYTGAAESAIHAFVNIPRPVQDRLIAKFEARQFDDFVFIDRDSIKGKQTYGGAIRSMHFGSKGKLCGEVTRNTWTIDHAETAIVVCDSGYCVAAPTVCSNWFIIDRREPEARIVSYDAPVVLVEPPESVVSVPAVPGPAVVGVGDTGGVTCDCFAGAVGVPISTGGGGGVVFVQVQPAPVSPVPEPSTVVMLLAGLGVVVRRMRK